MDALWTVLAGAFAAGLAAGPHCMGMCGPLACQALPATGSARGQQLLAWQLSRLGAYGVVGAAAGAMGGAVGGLLQASAWAVLPWVMLVGILATSFGLHKRLPMPAAFVSAFARLAQRASRGPDWLRPAVWGALTPLLPCGVLWGMLLVASGTLSAGLGAVAMVAFGLAGAPLLGFAQLQWRAWQTRPLAAWVLRRGLPLVTVGVLAWRGVSPTCH